VKLADQEKGIRSRSDTAPTWDRWERLVLQFCAYGWPLKWSYHNWCGGGDHPAKIFVSACLIWGPASVPPHLIVVGGVLPSPLPYDPNDPDSHPNAIFWQACASRLADALRYVADMGQPISHEWVDRIAALANREAALAHKEVMANFREDTAHWVIPVYPGFSTKDRNELARWVKLTADVRFGDDPVRQHATELAAMGWTAARIAAALGKSDDTVRRWLKKAA